MAKNYVGVTGFKRPEEVLRVSDIFSRCGFPNDEHTVMYGVLCSANRLLNPDEQGTISPSLNELPLVVGAAPEGSLPMIHYYSVNTPFYPEVKRVLESGDLYCSGACRAVQLNIEWPDIRDVEQLKREMPQLEIVLQVVPGKQGAEELARKAEQYYGLVEHLLVDDSRGQGKAMDPLNMAEVLVALRHYMPLVNLGVAGGLDGENLGNNLRNIRQVYKGPVSTDTHRGVRSGNNEYFVYDKVYGYARAARDSL